MLIKLDTSLEIPIYLQLKNQIVMGIGKGELKLGESLPAVRQMAADIGVNSMTVNKTYQLLKQEGYITIDRRKGACVCAECAGVPEYLEKLTEELELLSAQACLRGYGKEEFITLCGKVFDHMHPRRKEPLPE